MKKVITFGLDQHENMCLANLIAPENFTVQKAEISVDLIAYPGFLFIINPEAMNDDEFNDVMDFYLLFSIDEISETLVFIRDITLPEALKEKFLVYADFSELLPELENILLSAHQNESVQ